MACPTCKSKNLTEGHNIDEKMCRDCGCVYRESNETIFIEGSFDKVCESTSHFIMERIQDPILRTEVSSIIERYKNEGFEASEDLIRELEYIAEGLEISDSKSSKVIRNSSKKVKRIAENMLMGIGSMLPTITVNPMSQEEIPQEPTVCGEPEEEPMSPEEHLASMPYGDQVLEEEPGANLLPANNGQENPQMHNWEEPTAGTPYEDPYQMQANQDDIRDVMDQEIDDLQNPILPSSEDDDVGAEGPEGLEVPEPIEPEDEIMRKSRYDSVDQAVISGDRIFLESERGVTYTVDRVRGKFVDLVSDEGDKMTVDASNTMLYEAEELDVAWEKKEASLNNLRYIYESMEEDLDEGFDDWKPDPSELDPNDPTDQYMLPIKSYRDDDSLVYGDMDLDSIEVEYNGEDEEAYVSIPGVGHTIINLVNPDLNSAAMDLGISVDELKVALENKLPFPLEEGKTLDANGDSDMSIEGSDGISSEDGMMEGEDYTEEGDKGYECCEDDKIGADEDVDNVMNEEKKAHDAEGGGDMTVEGPDGLSSDEGEGKAKGTAKTDAPSKSTEDAEEESDGPDYSHAGEDDNKGDVWGAEQINETREMYTFLSSKLSYLVEHHLNDEIRAAWDTFSELGDKLSDIEKSYEAEYEKIPHPEMEVEDGEEEEDYEEDDDDDDDNGPDDGRKAEIEAEIEELQSELEQLSESILQQFVHDSVGHARNIGAPYVTERENGTFENARPFPEEVREEGGYGDDKNNGVYENIDVDDETAQGEKEYVDEEVDSEGTEEPPTKEAEQREELDYSHYGQKHHVAVNESLQVSDTVYVRNDFKRKWTVTKIDGDILHVKSGKKTAVINTINEDVQLVEGKDLMVERNMSIVNNSRAIWEEVEAEIEAEGKKVLTEGCDKKKKMEEEDEEVEDEEEKEVVEAAQIYSYIKERDLQFGDRATALQEVASKFANPIGEIENIFEDACRDREELDEIYSFSAADTGMTGIMESKKAWLEMERYLEDDDKDTGRSFFNI